MEMAPMPPEQQMPPPAAGAITAPPGGAMPKTGSAPFVKTAYGVGDFDIVGNKLLIYQAETGRKIGPGKKDRPWFYSDIPSGYRSRIQYSKDPSGGAWNAEVKIPLSVAKKHPGTKSWVQEAKKKQASVLTKQAMDYAKEGRPHSGLVLDDLASATSLLRPGQERGAPQGGHSPVPEGRGPAHVRRRQPRGGGPLDVGRPRGAGQCEDGDVFSHGGADAARYRPGEGAG